MSLARTRDFLEMIKFSHTLFALPFALLGAALAAFYPGAPSAEVAGLAGHPRSAWPRRGRRRWRSTAWPTGRTTPDQSPDRRPPHPVRPAQRPLGRGLHARVRPPRSSLATLLFLPNRWPLYLSVPVLLWLLGYSYAKRFTSLAHFWLGLSLSLSPVAAWIALRGDLAWPPVFLAEAVLLLGRRLRHHLRLPGRRLRPSRPACAASPAGWASSNALRLAAGCHALMIVPLIVLGVIYPLGIVYFAGVAAVAVLLVYEHALVRPDDLTRVNVAFFQVNIAISIGLLAVSVIDILVRRLRSAVEASFNSD